MPFVYAFQIFDGYEDFMVECSNFYINSFMNAVTGDGGVILIKPDHKTHTLKKKKNPPSLVTCEPFHLSRVE